MLHEQEVLKTFAKLADTLVAGYDTVELLQSLVESCQELLGVTDAGILLMGATGELELVASTNESSMLVETMQWGAEAGPAIESFTSGRAVSMPSLDDADGRWPRFGELALNLGYHSVHALPMRLREKTIGSLSLLNMEQGPLDEMDVLTAQALADVATIGILHERALHESSVLVQQLQGALNSRVVIEQAKGVISFTHGISVDAAFDVIRAHARSHRLGLSVVARQLVDGTLQIDAG
ncbi:MAG: transcriptional regulator [Schumannella sp.]|nr:transcriptional regulator [Schumannella sp.]